MKLILAFCSTALIVTGCASTPNYACSEGSKASSCQSLSETAKQTRNALPSKADSLINTHDNESKVTISIPKPKEGEYTYADEYLVESRAKNIPNKSIKEHVDSSAVTNKEAVTQIDSSAITNEEAVTHVSVDFDGDVKKIRSGGLQSNNKLAYVSPGTPLLTEPWVVSIYFTPYVNSYGDLDTGGNIYMKIQDSEWVLQK